MPIFCAQDNRTFIESKQIDGLFFYPCSPKTNSVNIFLVLLFCLYVNLFKDLFLVSPKRFLFSKADAKVMTFSISCKSFLIIFQKNMHFSNKIDLYQPLKGPNTLKNNINICKTATYQILHNRRIWMFRNIYARRHIIYII